MKTGLSAILLFMIISQPLKADEAIKDSVPANTPVEDAPSAPDQDTTTPEESAQHRLEVAEAHFKGGNFRASEKTIAHLATNLSKLNHDVRLRVILLKARLESTFKRLANARLWFARLYRDAPPDIGLDPLVDPPATIELWETVKREEAAATARAIERADAAIPPEPQIDSKPPAIEKSLPNTNHWLRLLPFGMGQALNEHSGKAIVIAMLESAALTYGLMEDDRKLSDDAFAFAGTTALYGAIDGWIYCPDEEKSETARTSSLKIEPALFARHNLKPAITVYLSWNIP